MKHFMIDLETLGLKPGCQILTVACARFDDNNIYEKFYKRIDLKDYNHYDLTVDSSTLNWWKRQDKKVYDEAFTEQPRESLYNVMYELREFIVKASEGGNIYIWSHGKEFDIPIVEYTFNLLDLDIPWKFWNTRDTRTLFHFMNIDYRNITIESEFSQHHALYDVERQIAAVQKCYSLKK